MSAIIPVFNRPKAILRALDSVIHQTLPVDEIIVIDDGSNDETATVLKHYPFPIKVITQRNRGVSAARNYGIQTATSQWLAFLDSDDEWLPQKIETFYKILQKEPDLLLFHSEEIWIRDGVRVNAMKKHQKSGGWIYEKCLPLCAISPSASIMKRCLFEKVGLFNEDLPACEDYEYWLRVCHQFPVTYYEKPLIVKYGGHNDQLSKKYWGMDRFRIEALINVLRESTLQEADRKKTLAMLCKKLKILLKGAAKHNNQDVLQHFQSIADEYECE